MGHGFKNANHWGFRVTSSYVIICLVGLLELLEFVEFIGFVGFNFGL